LAIYGRTKVCPNTRINLKQGRVMNLQEKTRELVICVTEKDVQDVIEKDSLHNRCIRLELHYSIIDIFGLRYS